MVKLSAAFFHDESSITIGGGGYESAIVPIIVPKSYLFVLCVMSLHEHILFTK